MFYKLMRLMRTVWYIPQRMWWARAVALVKRQYYRTPLYPILQDKERFLVGQHLVPHLKRTGTKAAGQAIVTENILTFNGETHALQQDWLPEQATLLWRFHLHYWDWLADLKAARKQKEAQALVRDWLLQCDHYHHVIWHPYPTSLRIVNALAYGTWMLEGAEDDLVDAYWQSVQRQVSFLQENMEWQLEGNHLIKNIKALIFAGLCLPGRQSLFLEGQRLLFAQLKVQILPDGLHFERSPMYHMQVLQDLLDIQCVMRQAGVKMPAQLQELIDRMGTALAFLKQPDGHLPLMHDGMVGEAKHVQALIKQTDADEVSHTLPDGGYVRLQHGKINVLCDVGKIGPDENPGHAHAQTLCCEVFVGTEPVFMNRGTYAYQTPRRQELRGTSAHNTVQVNGLDLAEVWAGFRVGRRPREVQFERTPLADGGHKLVAFHDGYRFLKVTHERTWEVSGAGDVLFGQDVIQPIRANVKFGPMRVRGVFHLAPGVTCQLLNETHARLTTPKGQALDFEVGQARLLTQPTTISRQFGEMTESVKLILQPHFRAGAQFTWALRLAK